MTAQHVHAGDGLAGRHAHHGHLPRERAVDDLSGVKLGVVYDRLTCSLQVISAQFILLTADRARLADPRDAGDARTLSLHEARAELGEIVPHERDRALHAALERCLLDLEALSASLRDGAGPLSGAEASEAFVRRLRGVATRLARCADHENDLSFFGSGGCGDSQHRYLHI
jgi:hypothetical protein